MPAQAMALGPRVADLQQPSQQAQQQQQQKKPASMPTRRNTVGSANLEITGVPATREQCSNPFRIPNHKVTSKLRNVPSIIRERLSHVSFGRRICMNCRKRVHDMLKERKYVKPSARLSESGSSGASAAEKRQKQRKSEPARVQPPPPAPTTTATTEPRFLAPPAAASVVAAPTPSAPRQSGENRSETRPTRSMATTTADADVVATSSPAEKEKIVEEVITPPRLLLPVPTTARDVVEQMAAIAPDHHSTSNLVDNLQRLSEDTMSRRTKSQLLQLPADLCPSKQICCFCGLKEDNELEYGKFYHYNGIITHYYCLLLSSNMEQKGSDDQGILGFLPEDIHKEIRRGKRLICSHCKKNGATLGCCNVKCKRIFHLPCGLKAGSLHQFFGEFRSYCINHRPKQKIDERLKKEIEKMSSILCYICYEDVKPLDSNETLWAPCCKKNAWFHRKCVQQLAMSAGYFFKCPLCNNKREFQTAMLEYGIYIPRQDASWELVPNAFEELLYRHDRCDAKACICPKGRTYTSSNAKWELVLCRTCGSQGVHVYCGQLKWSNPIWDCPECSAILKKSNENITEDSTSNSNESTRQIQNTINITIREEDDDSDSDISVGNESIPLESSLSDTPTNLPPVKLRPGPKSFKLQQVEQLKSTGVLDSSNSNNTNSTTTSTAKSSKAKSSQDIICLESDDDTPEILCESSMSNKIKMMPRLIPKYTEAIGTNSNHSSNFSTSALVTDSSPLSNQVTSIDLASVESEMAIPSVLSQSVEVSPFNIIISNVTSVPPEFFASVPEEPDGQEMSTLISPVYEQTSIQLDQPNTLKRSYPCDNRDDYQIAVDPPKRARLDNTVTHQNSGLEVHNTNDGIANQDDKRNVKTVMLNSVGANPLPEKAATTAGSSGVSSSLDSCHGDAGGRPVLDTSRSFRYDRSAVYCILSDNVTELEPAANSDISVTSREMSKSTHTIHNGQSSHYSSNGSHGGSTKSRYSDNRTGLIPHIVRLSDLKFKVIGNDVEIAYGTRKIQIYKNSIFGTDKLNDTNSSYRVAMSFAGSTQNSSSEKSSSKSVQLRSSDDSDESYRNLRSLRSRNLRSFVYEDDNTLLEYPTNDSQSNVKTSKKSSYEKNARLGRNDLKENWDPEVSNSANNTYENLNNNNNNQVNSRDLKNIYNTHERSNKQDDNSLVQKEDSNTNQRLLRRSNRIVRHFRSVQSSNAQNSLTNADSMDSNTNNLLSQSYEKSGQTTLATDQTVKTSRSLKILKSSDVKEQNKHLKNVNINDLRFSNTGKMNVVRSNNEIDTNKDFKVSIDLKKISKLMNAKPDLFFKTKDNGVRRLRVYRLDEKLKVELKTGEKVFLTKAQSFECLSNITKNDSKYSHIRSKSLNDLSLISNNNLNFTDKKNFTEKKIRRSQRHKSKHFEKHECVR